MRQYYSLMATGDDERPDPPDYNVYRSGRSKDRGSGGRSGQPPESGKGANTPSEDPGRAGSSGDPDYRVYRASRNPLSKLRGGDGDGPSLRDRLGRGGGDSAPRVPGEKPLWRKVLKWAMIGAAAWILLSIVLFAVSAQIQKGKLDDDTADLLGGNPLLAAFPQNILVIGTDARPEATGNPDAETRDKCIEQGAQGEAPSADCTGFRADTLMVVRAGGGAFEKLSIPRDTLADIPGIGPEKINAAYANGGASLQVETVENFLGIDIDHVVLLDFEGFAEFIDAIGGVTVDVGTRVKSIVDGGSGQGGITLKLERGNQTLTGDQALAYARTRNNIYNPQENDLDRARRQQEVLAGIKSRLTSITRLPINFLRGPLIAWNAPKAMVSDMGALTLPQLAIALAIGGEQGTQIIGKGSSISPAGNIVIPQEECERALRKFLGEDPKDPPPCSPPA
jgi:LCP family protein required for cell wall assembly